MRGAVINIDEAPRRELQPDRGVSVGLVNETLGSGRLDVHVNMLKPGAAGGPYHYHNDSENVYVVLEGRVRVWLDGVEHNLHPGHVVFIPPGVPHSASNVDTSEARILEIYAPPRPDFMPAYER